MEAGGRNKKICRICRAGGGVCRQGLRKTHERTDPACRFHGSDARGNTAVARGDVTRGADQAAPRGEGSGEAARPRQHVPFEQMTRFVTKAGIGLHYLPGPLDQWACRDVVDREGEWHDNQAGRPLNEAEKGEYTQHIQRHEARRQNGERSGQACEDRRQVPPRRLAGNPQLHDPLSTRGPQAACQSPSHSAEVEGQEGKTSGEQPLGENLNGESKGESRGQAAACEKSSDEQSNTRGRS